MIALITTISLWCALEGTAPMSSVYQCRKMFLECIELKNTSKKDNYVSSLTDVDIKTCAEKARAWK